MSTGSAKSALVPSPRAGDKPHSQRYAGDSVSIAWRGGLHARSEATKGDLMIICPSSPPKAQQSARNVGSGPSPSHQCSLKGSLQAAFGTNPRVGWPIEDSSHICSVLAWSWDVECSTLSSDALLRKEPAVLGRREGGSAYFFKVPKRETIGGQHLE